jgi:hypothetical protein
MKLSVKVHDMKLDAGGLNTYNLLTSSLNVRLQGNRSLVSLEQRLYSYYYSCTLAPFEQFTVSSY